MMQEAERACGAGTRCPPPRRGCVEAHGTEAGSDGPPAYLGLGLGLGLLVADTSYAPRGILNIVIERKPS